MANPYPAHFVDDSGIIRESGEIDFTDANNQPTSLPFDLTGGTAGDSDLLLITEPAAYAANSPTGNVIRVHDPDSNSDTLLVDAYGDIIVTAPAGQGSAQLRLTGADAKTLTIDTSSGIGLSSNQALSCGDLFIGGNTQVGNAPTDTVGFYGHAPTAQQTGVAVTAAAIHAALVALGLITA